MLIYATYVVRIHLRHVLINRRQKLLFARRFAHAVGTVLRHDEFHIPIVRLVQTIALQVLRHSFLLPLILSAGGRLLWDALRREAAFFAVVDQVGRNL